MRPIDADALMQTLSIVAKKFAKSDAQQALMGRVMYIIDHKPECVTRCRECRWRGREECAMFYLCDCGEQHTWETDDDFCSWGEREDSDSND